MNRKSGKSTFYPQNVPSINYYAAIAGEVEDQGPLHGYYDLVVDDLWEEKSWEKAEEKMFENAVKLAMQKANLQNTDIDFLFGGDLLNQIISASFAARTLAIPFLGLYGACSTMAESLIAATMALDGGYAQNAVCVTGSHFATAERQYRMPLEMGTQTTPTAQRTVTGAGACVIQRSGDGPYITCFTVGKVIDLGIKDADNLGAAMAPAAIDTLITHFEDTGKQPNEYDLIVTGDLGKFGFEIVLDKMRDAGYDLSQNYNDCGMIVFDVENQDVDCGGSGCGCSAVTLNAYLLKKIKKGDYRNILFVPTGALLSPTTTLQGESIPSIAHAVVIQKEV
ncbi:MAG: stage V sporulation protein AD [Christensenellales bacterium]|jgi:stage V sporulation protein AD